MPAILLIGEDEFLLETRAAVLRATGADIARCDVSSALCTLEVRMFDIVVLCHSIAGHLSETLAGIIQQNWPGTRILRVCAVQEWDETAGVYTCPCDPQALIGCAIKLLGRRPVRSVGTPKERSATA